MSKIFVTGGIGFIGSHVVELFIVRGFKVFILEDFLTWHLSNINLQSAFYQKEQVS